jgi:cytochrome c-type biogenesis protein CcmE
MTTAPPVGPAGTDAPGTARTQGAPSGGHDAHRAGSARARSSHRIRYAVVGLVLAGSFVFLVVKGLGSALNFYLPADQALAQRATLGSQTFNLEGVVQPGSIHATSRGVDFVVTSGSTHLEVENSNSPPQLFQPDIPVIAVGHFAGTVFVSDQILVKHSSTYIASHPGRVTAPNGSKR